MKYILTIITLSFLIACASPKSMFTLEKNVNHAPATVKFTNTSTKATKYLWDFGDGKTSEEVNPIHKYVLSGKFQVTLKAINDKKSNMSNQEIILDPPHHCLVELQTSLGVMTIQLYDETPLHRDNFLKLAEEGFYEGTLFHRVIKGFMVQAGDPDSKDAPAAKRLGSGGPGYTVPAEFVDTLVHLKGALSAARQGDQVNPKKASSGSQFYIVQGKPVPTNQLESMEMQKGMKYTDAAKEAYSTIGGTPFLDKDYTVFGRVIKGLEIIDAIAASQTDSSDRPTTDVKIISIKVIK